MKATRIFILAALCLPLPSFAADELTLSANQKQTLGISSAPLPPKQQGELAGMPAQVVIPGNQLFTVSTPLSAMVEQTLVGVGDAVKKGQVLATLQSPALAEAQRGLLQASTQSQLAKDNLARVSGEQIRPIAAFDSLARYSGLAFCFAKDSFASVSGVWRLPLLLSDIFARCAAEGLYPDVPSPPSVALVSRQPILRKYEIQKISCSLRHSASRHSSRTTISGLIPESISC